MGSWLTVVTLTAVLSGLLQHGRIKLPACPFQWYVNIPCRSQVHHLQIVRATMFIIDIQFMLMTLTVQHCPQHKVFFKKRLNDFLKNRLMLNVFC